MTRVLIFGVVFSGLGGAIAIAAWRLLSRHRREVGALRKTSGRVIRIEESDVDGQRMYQPVVQFVHLRHDYTVVDTTFHGQRAWQVDDALDVFFDPANPNDARLSKETGSLFGAQLFGMFGVTFLVIGAIALVAYALGPDSALGAFVRDALA